MLLIVTSPLLVPEALGAKDTVKFAACDAASVSGTEMPLNLYPVPLIVALEMVTLLPPVFFTCTVCEFVTPVATVPKLIGVGVALRFPAVAVPPVPLSVNFTLLFDALLVKIT